MKQRFAILLVTLTLCAGIVIAQDLPSAGSSTSMPAPTMGAAPGGGPMSEQDVSQELKKKVAPDDLIKELQKRGVTFETDAEIEKHLRKAKATDAVVAAVKAAGPKEREAEEKAKAIASGATIIPKEEAADFKAIESELDPDKAISLTQAYEQKYPKSDVLSYVYAFEASAYQNKGDAQKAVDLSEKALSIKGDNLMALLIVTSLIPQPQFVKLHQSDEDQQLQKADSYCKDADKAIGELKKTETESDADFSDRKAAYTSSIHADRGMIHLDRAQLGLMSLDTDELKKAVEEYNQAVSYPRAQATEYFRLGEANRMLGKTDDAIAAFTKASELGSGVLKQYSDAQIASLKSSKGGATKQ